MKLQEIPLTHPLAVPLTYPLLFLHGEHGWGLNGIPYSTAAVQQRVARARGFVTAHEYFRARLFDRRDTKPTAASPGRDGDTCGGDAYLFQGPLTQQWMVDEAVKIEASKLKFIRHNQTQLKADLYKEVQRAVLANEQGVIGQHFVLPSSYIGSPRDMQQRYADSMALVRNFGKPDIFLTFTCNPSWPEITRELPFGQKAHNHPRLCARVFNLKLEELKKDILERHVLGRVKAYTYVIEFQKRGLPHAHMLLILENDDKPRDATQYDAIVCAEIPAGNTPKKAALRAKVLKHMVHRHRKKCYSEEDPGNRNCLGGFPKDFVDSTLDTEDSYPHYRRREPNYTTGAGTSIDPPADDPVPAPPVRNAGKGAKGNRKGAKGAGQAGGQGGKGNSGRGKGRGHGIATKPEVDNRFVVPYNPYLLEKFDVHMNVEICSSITSVKYLYKYVYKGHDRVMYRLECADGGGDGGNLAPQLPAGQAAPGAAHQAPVDEISRYVDARYLTSSEAVWKAMDFPMSGMNPRVDRLPVHLKNEQSVVLDAAAEGGGNIAHQQAARQEALDRAEKTRLTSYFDVCRVNNHADTFNGTYPPAEELTYQQFPQYYTCVPTPPPLSPLYPGPVARTCVSLTNCPLPSGGATKTRPGSAASGPSLTLRSLAACTSSRRAPRPWSSSTSGCSSPSSRAPQASSPCCTSTARITRPTTPRAWRVA